MFTDPLTVTYDGSTKTLPRTGMSRTGSIYRTANGEFAVKIANFTRRNGFETRSIELMRTLPDLTPSDVFDPYRDVSNSFGVTYGFDLSRGGSSNDLPLLRTALLALVDSTFAGRLIGGEK